MSKTILTLFGEEIIPEEINAVGRGRAAKKKAEKVTGDVPEEAAPVAKVKKIAVKKKVEAADTDDTSIPDVYEAGAKTKDILEGFKGDKQYYTIGEVSKLFGVKTSHIRFWTNEFALKVRTTRKGDRLYTAEQIRELRTIHHLVKERGFTIAGAKAKLKSHKKMAHQSVDLRQSLLQLRNRLLTIKNQLS